MASFVLGSSRLEGVEEDRVVSIVADRGRFLDLQWSQGGANQDMELLGFAAKFFTSETTAMASPADAFSSADYAYVDTPLEDRGVSVQMEWSVNGANQDLELLGFGLRFEPAEDSASESS